MKAPGSVGGQNSNNLGVRYAGVQHLSWKSEDTSCPMTKKYAHLVTEFTPGRRPSGLPRSHQRHHKILSLKHKIPPFPSPSPPTAFQQTVLLGAPTPFPYAQNFPTSCLWSQLCFHLDVLTFAMPVKNPPSLMNWGWRGGG